MVKKNQTADELRENALRMLREAKAKKKEEEQKLKMELGELVQNWIEGKITDDEFRQKVEELTGKKFASGDALRA